MPGKLALNKIIRGFGIQCALIEPQPRQREAAPSDRKPVIAGGDCVSFAPFLNEHSVVCKRWFSSFQHAFYACKSKIIACFLRIIAKRDVRHCKLHLLCKLKQYPSGHAVLRTDIRMNKRVCLYTVYVPQKQPQHFFRICSVLFDHKRLQKLIQITEINREGCDRRNVAVKYLQNVHCFQKILRRIQLQKITAFFKEQLIIRAYIARSVGHNSFVQVAESAFALCLIVFVRIAETFVSALAEAGERKQLLFIC